ncbi:hypothetical protein C8R42DRAFT_671233 [Lentinula raphanica]|nr:hypothetical protein C8R42DRAFT_671233 [Lentinula raphanica]
MDKYSRVAWHANPHASAGLTDAERELARKLFASAEVAWNHPALQKCLKKHMDRQSSNLNTMTLFSVIWKHECPGSHNSHSVWMAMRTELDGVLAKLVSRFHAHTKGENGVEETSGDQNSYTLSKSQELRWARGTRAHAVSALRQTQASTGPEHEELGREVTVNNPSLISSVEPSLQLPSPYARSIASEPGRRQLEGNPNCGPHDMVQVLEADTIKFSVAMPGVYDPNFEQSLDSQFIQSFGPGAQAAQQSTVSSTNLASATSATLRYTLQSDPFSMRAGSYVYHTGSEHPPHFVPSFNAGTQRTALESDSNLARSYMLLDPCLWRGDPYPPQWTGYQTVTDSESFNTYPVHPSMAPHTAPISPQDSYTLGDQGYRNNGGCQKTKDLAMNLLTVWISTSLVKP